MIEVQCPSCQTRYRIDESVLPQDSPTFKCSRCGHVFSGDPRAVKRATAVPKPRPAAPAAKSSPPQQDAPAAQAASPPPPEPQARSGPSPRQMNIAADVTPSPAQRASSTANFQPPPPDLTQPRRDPPSPDLHNESARPPQPRQTGDAAATNTNYSPPPVAPPARPAAPAPAPGRGGRGESQADNPLARSFGEEEPKTPENLSFDFADDPAEQQHHMGEAPEAAEPEDRYDRWRVGDPDAEPIAQPPPEPGIARYQARRAAIAQASMRVDRASMAGADESEHDRVRSSGFFLGLFALIVIGFGLFTFILGISPSVSRELLSHLPVIGSEFTSASPQQNPVSLSGVHAEYRLLDGHRRALIVSGRAENRGAEALHAIEVGVSLVDNQERPVLSQSVFCGDLVSPKIVSQMTPHELQFFQKLAPPRNFALKSGDSSPFFVMFINPPPNVINFHVSVLKAEPASGESMAAAGL
jgi:predicted Zn finger-like uncharacterized protein